MLSGIRAMTKVVTHPQLRYYTQTNQNRFQKLSFENAQKFYKGVNKKELCFFAILIGGGVGGGFGAHHGFKYGSSINTKMICGPIGLVAGGLIGGTLVWSLPVTFPLFMVAKCYQSINLPKKDPSVNRIDNSEAI